jgi:hypothetical protein
MNRKRRSSFIHQDWRASDMEILSRLQLINADLAHYPLPPRQRLARCIMIRRIPYARIDNSQ